MKVIAYTRVSTNTQDLANQRLEILEYANRNGLKVDGFIEVEASTRKDQRTRRIPELIEGVEEGDVVVTSELSRLGRSVVEVITTVNGLSEKNVRLIAVKEALDIKGGHDMPSKVLVTLFSLLAEIERDLISERTKAALHAARAGGKTLGRPKGSTGKSKLDGKKEEILMLLGKKVAKAAIARILGTSRTNLAAFMKKKGLA